MEKKWRISSGILARKKLYRKKNFCGFNYINYSIKDETKELSKRNYTTKISEKIIGNEKIKEMIIKNM